MTGMNPTNYHSECQAIMPEPFPKTSGCTGFSLFSREFSFTALDAETHLYSFASQPPIKPPSKKSPIGIFEKCANSIVKEFDTEGKSNGGAGINLDYFGARYYDPEVGNWTSTDLYEQFWNPYGYAANPISMVDPDGNFFFGNDPVTWTTFYSQLGFDLQKQLLPVAFHIGLSFGTEQTGIGFDVSVGGSSLSPMAYRKNYGATYWYSYYDNSYSGWETRNGGEYSTVLLGPVTFSGTKISSGDISQYAHRLSVGLPGVNAVVENDGIGAMLLGDINYGNAMAKLPGLQTGESDAWRSAAVSINLAGLSCGTNLFTGNPSDGSPPDDRERRADGKEYYNGGTADQYRAGVFWVGFGAIRVGVNSEGIRNYWQNEKVHDPAGIPRFTVLKRKPELFFYFGSGTGGSQW